MRVSTPLFYILQYGCCYHTIYIWLVTAVCLYIETLLAYNRVLKNASGVLESPEKVLELFVTKSGNPALCIVIESIQA